MGAGPDAGHRPRRREKLNPRRRGCAMRGRRGDGSDNDIAGVARLVADVIAATGGERP